MTEHEQGQEQELHLLEHLTELRKRILITLGTFLVALCAAFLYVEPLYEMLTRDVEGQLQVLGPTDVIWVYFMIAGVIALAVTMPVAGFQVWRFVVPGLSTVERRASWRISRNRRALPRRSGLWLLYRIPYGPVLPGFALESFHYGLYRRKILPLHDQHDRTVRRSVRNAGCHHVLNVDRHSEPASLIENAEDRLFAADDCSRHHNTAGFRVGYSRYRAAVPLI